MKQILVIEDDQDIAELERDYLQLNGYAATIISDGAQGLVEALSGNYQLIVVDLMLPNKSGFEIIKEIRQKLEIPLLIVSARSEDIDKIRGLDCGADDYLTKPFSPAELVARIRSHIKRYERLKGTDTITVIQHRGLEIHPASRQVCIDGQPVALTTKEYDLLFFLATHPNRVFSKTHLFDALWSDEFCGDTATVAVHIQKIRKKIEPTPAIPQYIETLWGAGYRFNA